VKRTLAILAAVATLATGAYLGNYVRAQQQGYQQGSYSQPQTQAAPLQSKIAIVNIYQVIKNYKKYQGFEADIKTKSTNVQHDLENKKAQVVSYQKEMEKAETPPTKRDEYEREIKRIQREMQDTVDDAKQKLTKEEYDEMVKTYREVSDAVEVYARAYGIELVLQYGDGVGSEKFQPPHFQARLNNRACIPIYVDPRMDITGPITTMLNQKFASAAGRAPASN
jgi:Skp family chaperone for outer membrane proteins